VRVSGGAAQPENRRLCQVDFKGSIELVLASKDVEEFTNVVS
jgi:hypothetical protein